MVTRKIVLNPSFFEQNDVVGDFCVLHSCENFSTGSVWKYISPQSEEIFSFLQQYSPYLYKRIVKNSLKDNPALAAHCMYMVGWYLAMKKSRDISQILVLQENVTNPTDSKHLIVFHLSLLIREC